MSQWWETIDDPRAATVQCLAGTNRLSGIPSKPGMVCAADSIYVRHAWNLTDAALIPLFSEYLCQAMTGLEIQRAPGVGGDHLVAPMGICDYLYLQWILHHKTVLQQIMAAGGNAGVTQVPLWKSRYPWDIESYPCPINEVQTVRYTRAGATGVDAVTADVATLAAQGRFFAAGTVDAPGFVYRPRSWFMTQETTDTFTLPGGWRYHFIAIVNSAAGAATNANLFNGGLSVYAANAQITNIDGQDIQRKFVADYELADLTSLNQDDDAALSAILDELADYIQPVYAPEPETIRYEDGLIGPVTVRIIDPTDPGNNNVFCCACPM